ncbi:MAG: hypothetical protein ACREI3_11290 [Nitrospirales bacterium]
MPVNKGDIIDEHKRHPEGCGLVVKIMGGGAGFEKIVCCDHDLTEEDIVSTMPYTKGRRRGTLPAAVILDEKRLHPDSCGLRVMIMDGGQGFKEIRCCGHSLDIKAMNDMRFGQLRGGPASGSGPQGTA